MLKWLGKADSGADVIVRWGGLYLIVTGALSWLNRQLPWFRDLRWPELIFIALWMALLAVFLVAASLALFRYFRPLEAPTEEIDAGEAAGSYIVAGIDRKAVDERITALEQKLGRLEGALMDQLKKIEAGMSLNSDYVRQQIASLYEALGAIYSRERLMLLAQGIEDLATELDAPTTNGATYTEDNWEDWKATHSLWKRTLHQWCDLAGCYASGVEGIADIHHDQLQQKGQAKVEQFPDTEAFIEYKTFWIMLKQWRAFREEAERP